MAEKSRFSLLPALEALATYLAAVLYKHYSFKRCRLGRH